MSECFTFYIYIYMSLSYLHQKHAFAPPLSSSVHYGMYVLRKAHNYVTVVQPSLRSFPSVGFETFQMSPNPMFIWFKYTAFFFLFFSLSSFCCCCPFFNPFSKSGATFMVMWLQGYPSEVDCSKRSAVIPSRFLLVRLKIHRDELQLEVKETGMKLDAVTDMWKEIDQEKLRMMRETQQSRIALDRERMAREQLELRLQEADQEVRALERFSCVHCCPHFQMFDDWLYGVMFTEPTYGLL